MWDLAGTGTPVQCPKHQGYANSCFLLAHMAAPGRTSIIYERDEEAEGCIQGVMDFLRMQVQHQARQVGRTGHFYLSCPQSSVGAWQPTAPQ
jgi:hypothetical protein